MRKALALILVIALAASPALADSVKVLILDRDLKGIPKKEEDLETLDRLKGDLIVGFSSYKGQLEVLRGKDGLYIVNEISLEDYVEGVVKAETADNWALEALKAQAVIVRTYVIRQALNQIENRYHVTSTVLHQVYKGLNTDPFVSEAVEQTESEILAFDSKPIMAFYHSTAGGKTELPEEVFGQSYPYLKSVEASGRLSPLKVWARRIELNAFEKALGTGRIQDIQVASRTATGRVKELVISAHEGETEVKATELRKLLGWRRLPSTSFTIGIEGDYAVLEGSGYGHGVGLCQWTALDMARQGMTYREILSHFYPGAELVFYEDILI